MLVESFLAAKRPTPLVALVHWIVSWGVEVLVESLLAVK
jgi:hypothetical protein